jgi:hypothetical protein
MDDLEMSLLSKIKNSDVKFEEKMKELEKNNTKMVGAFRKIDHFNALMEEVKS